MRTFGSDLTVTVGGSITLSGYTIYSTPDPGNLLLIAGQNISIGSSAQVIANGTANSSLTLVVDNNFPTAPNIGPGQFLLEGTGTVSTGAVGTTPLRIYTARPSQNTITTSINGIPFVEGPPEIDSPTEEWATYYPGGAYGGVQFTIYYKEPQPVPPIPFANIVANSGQLADLLPVLNVMRTPYQSLNYHFQLCVEMRMGGKNWDVCDPILSPYGSFIFEDDLYWVWDTSW
jgi:hypothetical protein